jgi:hypothetical protein
MSERLGQVVVNQDEELCVSLREIRGEPHVELRVMARATPAESSRPAGLQSVHLPVGLLPELLRAMTEARQLLTKRGLIPSTEVTVMEQGEPVTVRLAPQKGRVDCRRHPRVHLSLPLECRLVDPAKFWPGKWITGEVKDVSIGGAQVWLPERLPLFKQLEVSIVIEGSIIRARADIVGVELKVMCAHDKRGYRHSLQWVEMEPQGRAALSKMVPMTAPRDGAEDSPILRSWPSGLESRMATGRRR